MRKLVTVLLGLLCIVASTSAQRRVVTGKVVGDDSLPVPSASIQIKGTATGVAADAQGNFSISASPTDVLVVSSLNYGAQEITVGNRSVIEVKLSRSSISTIEEVVVTALGVSRGRRALGYSATTFKPDDITRTSPVSPLDALQGKVAGADISTVGGQPGASSKIILRGYSSLQGNNQALIVVDGVPFNNTRPASGTRGDPNLLNAQGGNDFGNGLNDLNPNDIESITILKGAAASSLYGSRAQNGAVIITTKKGKAGKLQVDISSSAIMSSVGKLPEMQNEWGQGWNGIHYKEENGSWGPRLDGRDRLWGSMVDNSRLIKPFVAQEDNMRNFYDNGIELNNSVSLRGGNDVANFMFSYGNVYSNGVIPSNNDSYLRHTVALRAQVKASDKFVISSSFNYINKNARTVTTDNDEAAASTFEDIIQIPRDIPITDLKDYKNKFFNVDNYYSPFTANPYFLINENGNRYASDRFFGNVDLTYFFSKAISLQWRTGADFTNARMKDWQAIEAPRSGSWRGPNPTNFEGASYTAKVGGLTEQSNYAGELNSDIFLNVKYKIFQDLSINGFVGANFNQRETRRQKARITQLTIPEFYNLSNSSSSPTAEAVITKRRLFGAYAQANFEYKNFLYLTLNARNDRSSTLPKTSRSFFYPGANASFVVSNVVDMGKKVDFLKVRGAYGKTGNDADPYLLESVLTSGDVLLGFGNIIFPLNGVPSFEISNIIGNNTLKPEITTEIELGAEAQFFGNRLGFDVSVYRKRSDGQILNIPIAASTGYRSIVSNFGRLENKGIEVTATLVPVKSKNFTWNISYTYTRNRNKVMELPAGLDKVDFSTYYDVKMVARAGQPMGLIEAPTVETTADGKFIVNPVNGFYVTTNNDVKYGNVQKDFMMGLNNAFTYKNWRLGFTLDYRKGGSMISHTAGLMLFTGNALQTSYNDRRPFVIPNSVVQTGTDVSGKPVYAENTTVIDKTNYNSYWYQTSNRGYYWRNVILPKTFIKLRDITLTYTLPKEWAGKISAQYISLSAIGRNFLIWTPKENSYIDPEVSDISNDFLGEFGELATSPAVRSYGVSLRIGF
jgi:TonB-linked SusC/RagA family outer membrane protein